MNKAIHVILDRKTLPQLGHIADVKQVSRSAIIRWAVEEYLDRFVSTESLQCINHFDVSAHTKKAV